ncbi:MAG: DUF5686 and carboxypeptidase regulatory-like domain-containing protein [Flavobacteriales bacterium]|jgi:hypothetical protein|nr:DUF5686 and carboxypeptidase regulatory-like domain-containing protein [Flavobacteriales bacterium]
MKYILLLIITLISHFFYAGAIKGKILDTNNEVLPFASVYIKNTSYGTTSNLKGEYFLEIEKGKHTIVYSFIGFQIVEKEIEITSAHQTIELNIQLKEDVALLADVEIVAKTRDRAKIIMKEVRAKRTTYLNAINQYACKTYLKSSLEKEPVIKNQADSLSLIYTPDEQQEDRLKKQNLNLIETISTTYFKAPNRYKEIIEAHHDYAEVDDPMGVNNISFGMEIGESQVAQETGEDKNPYLIYTDISNSDFNFYKNKISFSAISAKPFISPLANSSALSYAYDYKGSFIEDGKKIYHLEVIPRFKNEALFYGSIYIEDSTWALKSVDLNVNKGALFFCSEFKIIQNYEQLDSTAYLPVRRELFYNIKDGDYNIIGNTRVNHSNYNLSPTFPKKTFNSEVKRFEVDAFDKDEQFWDANRPITLKKDELTFIGEYDSLVSLYTSPEYLKRVDSAFNKINIWSFLLTGIGHKNSFKGTEFRFRGLINQIVPLGVGGYRHRLGGYFNKEFPNNYLLETEGQIDYGFKNKDVKGKVGVGLTYVPLKFVRTFIRFGDSYELINQNASFTAVLSRSNYVRSKNVSIAQRMEIINGLYAEATLSYQHQLSLEGLQLVDYSALALGDTADQSIIENLNTPTSFEDYKKTEIELSLKYRFKQKYYIKNNKKVITEAKLPIVSLKYRRGIPNMFNSEVDFEYIEVSAEDHVRLPQLGYSTWKVSTGTFTNKNNLRVLEHKYFRGSDAGLFADPLNSFQLMGYQFDTRNEYFQANYIHHFEGAILNKVPLINRLKLQLVGGAGTLLIRDIDFAHFEAFGGLERIFNVRLFGETQPLRLGGYFVTADNTLDNANFRFKVGIDFYDSSRKKWNY